MEEASLVGSSSFDRKRQVESKLANPESRAGFRLGGLCVVVKLATPHGHLMEPKAPDDLCQIVSA